MSVTIKFVFVRWSGCNVPFTMRGKYGVVQGDLEKQFTVSKYATLGRNAYSGEEGTNENRLFGMLHVHVQIMDSSATECGEMLAKYWRDGLAVGQSFLSTPPLHNLFISSGYPSAEFPRGVGEGSSNN